MLKSVPRLCGDEPVGENFIQVVAILFPAYAGMNRHGFKRRAFPKTVPRLCGDEPADNRFKLAETNCSPPMRG